MTGYSWINQYIGIPYKIGGEDRNGIDCYGLVYLVMREQFNVLLPSHGKHINCKRVLMRELTSGFLKQLEFGQIYQVEKPRDFDLMIQQRARAVLHIGVFVNNGVLHASDFDKQVVYDDLRTLNLKGYQDRHYYTWLK